MQLTVYPAQIHIATSDDGLARPVVEMAVGGHVIREVPPHFHLFQGSEPIGQFRSLSAALSALLLMGAMAGGDEV